MKKEVTIVLTAEAAIKALALCATEAIDIADDRKVTMVLVDIHTDDGDLKEVRVTLTIEDR